MRREKEGRCGQQRVGGGGEKGEEQNIVLQLPFYMFIIHFKASLGGGPIVTHVVMKHNFV